MALRRLPVLVAVVVAAWVLTVPAVARGQCLECLQKALAAQWNAYDDEIVQSWENYKKTDMQVTIAARLPAGPQRDQLLATARRLHADAETRWRYAQGLMRELTRPDFKAFFTADLTASQQAFADAAAALKRKTAAFKVVDKKLVPLRQDALREMQALWQEEDRGRTMFLHDSGAAAVAAASVAMLSLAQYLPADQVAQLKTQLKAAGIVSATTGVVIAQAPAGPDTQKRDTMKSFAQVGGFLLSTTGALLDMPVASRVALGRAATVPVLAILTADAGYVLLARRQFAAADARLTKALDTETAWRNRLAEDQERVATLRAARDRAAEQVHRLTTLENEVAARTQK